MEQSVQIGVDVSGVDVLKLDAVALTCPRVACNEIIVLSFIKQKQEGAQLSYDLIMGGKAF